MKKFKLGIVSTLLALSMAATLGLSGCGIGEQVAQLIEGDVTGEVNKEYETKWFTFTVDSMSLSPTYEDYTASEGNILLIAHVTETNISGDKQQFGTFDWYVSTPTLSEEEYVFPLDPLNDNMMPIQFYLEDQETASYDVIIEYSEDLADPLFTYAEIDTNNTIYTTFTIPIK